MQPILDLTLGDDRELDFAVVDRGGAPEDITGWVFWFTVKSSPADADAAALFQLTSAAAQIVIDIAGEGVGRVLVRAAHTKGKTPGKYRWDLQCRKGGPGAQIETLASGILKLTEEITLAE